MSLHNIQEFDFYKHYLTLLNRILLRNLLCYIWFHGTRFRNEYDSVHLKSQVNSQ